MMIECGYFIILILAFLASIGVTFFTTHLFIKIAFARGILDNPTTLKNHKSPTPYLGGLAVYSSFIIVLALFFPVYWNLSLFLIGATLLLLIGLVDDLMPLSALYKFLGQIISCLCFIKGGFILKQEFIDSFSYSIVPPLLLIVSFFWILTVINAFNLVDIMDGLATTCALGSLSGFFIFSYSYALYSVSLVIVICIGALLGFLYFNKAPAKIYLGDAGSLFIGGVLATIPFMIPWGTHTVLGFFSPVIILAIPLCEVMCLIVIRIIKNIPFYLGSRDHFAHYLLDQGWSRRDILFFVTGTNSALIIISFLFNKGQISFLCTIAILTILLIIWCATIYRRIISVFIEKK